MVKTLFPMQEAQILSLAGELRFHMWYHVAKIFFNQ